MKIKKIYLIFLFFLFSCVNSTKKYIKDNNLDDEFITQDTAWHGTIIIKNKVTIMKGVTLTILPGTTIKFLPLELNNNTNPHETSNGIIVEGKIKALGTKENLIIFTSNAQNPNIGDWSKILFSYSKNNFFQYCKFEYAWYAMHAHFSTGEIINCTFTNNDEGVRLGMSSFVIKYSAFINNRSRGINFRNCENIIEYNEITKNSTGIFLYEKNSRTRIVNNNIYENKKYNIELGEFYKEDISLPENFWGSQDLNNIYNLIYDNNDDKNLGKVQIEPINVKIQKAGVEE